jgi:hypothetical protein
MTGPEDFRRVFDGVVSIFCPDTLECFWDDGKGLDRRYFRSRHWKLYRSRVIAATSAPGQPPRCEVCGKEFQWGHDEPRVHHLTYDRLGCEELEKDCIAVCGECHEWEHATDTSDVRECIGSVLAEANTR